MKMKQRVPPTPIKRGGVRAIGEVEDAPLSLWARRNLRSDVKIDDSMDRSDVLWRMACEILEAGYTLDEMRDMIERSAVFKSKYAGRDRAAAKALDELGNKIIREKWGRR